MPFTTAPGRQSIIPIPAPPNPETYCEDQPAVVAAQGKNKTMMAGGAVAGLVIGLTVAVLIVRASMANEKARGRTGGFWSWVGRRWGQGACFTLGTLMLVSAAMAGEYGVSSTLIAGVVFLVLAVILRIVSKLRPIQPAATSDRAPLVG